MSAAAAPALSLWRPSPARFARLVTGLWIFGTGEALIIASGLGNSPWTVLSQGVARQTPLAIGAATVLISFVVLLLWVPLRQRPGLGTLMNAVLVGIAIDVALLALPEPDEMALAVRGALVAAGIAVVAVGSGLYLTCRLGPGPRDGLMSGLSRRTGRSLRLWRTLVEASALIAGVVLGGVAGIGTVAFALLIGPAVQAAVQRLDDPARGAL